MKDCFLTMAAPSEGYYMDRGSKFLAYAFPVQSEEEAAQRLQELKKLHPKARHYCTALRLFPDASLERSSDDGEPSGSAGKPILGQLIKQDLTNVFLVVVRYFGGTKLGVPGLIEAYKTSAANAITAGRIMEKKVFSKVQFTISYEASPVFLNILRLRNHPVFSERYGELVEVDAGFAKSSAPEEIMALLKQYSQFDFATPEDYAAHLSMQIRLLPGDEIL